MPTGTSATRKPQRRFQFIDNSDVASSGQNSTQVRRHVMQEYMREKRWEARSKAETATDEHEMPLRQQTQTQIQPSPKAAIPRAAPRQRRQIKRDSIDSSSSGTVVGNQQHASLPLNQKSHTLDHAIAHSVSDVSWFQPTCTKTNLLVRSSGDEFYLNAESFAALADMFPVESPSSTHTIASGSSWSPPTPIKEEVSPLSVLSAARTDPFDVLPMRLNAKDQELFDFYAVVMPSCSYGFERRHHKAHNWYRDVFIPEAMKGPVSFKNTILVHAANTQAVSLFLGSPPRSDDATSVSQSIDDETRYTMCFDSIA